MARGFRMGGAGGGGPQPAEPEFLAPINTLSASIPSDTASSQTTKRTFVRNSFVVGLTNGNNYMPSNVPYYGTPSYASVTPSTAYYGMGLVLSSSIKPEHTYRVNWTTDTATYLRFDVLYYASDGTYLDTYSLKSSSVTRYTFTVPSNASYVVLVLSSSTANQTARVTIDSIVEVTGSFLAPLNTLVLTTPSSTASSTSTKRTWNKNSYIKDLFANNTYYAGTIQNNSVILTENSVKFTPASNGGGYGVGFVLNDNVIAGKTYEIDASYSEAYTTPISVMFYQSDGTFISNLDGTTFTVPSNASYTIVLCRGKNSTQATFIIDSITEVTT